MINTYLARTKSVLTPGMFGILDSRPRIVCADGFTLSVQASRQMYCSPLDNDGPYDQVEVGFPSAHERTIQNGAIDLRQYREQGYGEGGDIYPYIPVWVVEAWIAEHGGIANMPAVEPERVTEEV